MYTPVYHEEAFRQILALRPASRRESVLRQIQFLAERPLTEGDYEVKDPTGRANQVRVMGGLAVTYWPDHAVRELRIVDVRLLAVR